MGWALTALAIANRAKPTYRPSPTLSFVTYVDSASRELSTAGGPVVLHQIRYRSDGEAATVRWFDSDFAPVRLKALGIVCLYIDGKCVASTMKTSLTGAFEDGPGDLVWRGRLHTGWHRIAVEFDSNANWALPHADPGSYGADELIVEQARQ